MFLSLRLQVAISIHSLYPFEVVFRVMEDVIGILQQDPLLTLDVRKQS